MYVTSSTTLVYRHSSNVVIRQRFDDAWSGIGKLCTIFHSTAADALIFKKFKSAVKAIAAYALESLPLYHMPWNLSPSIICPGISPPQSDNAKHA